MAPSVAASSADVAEGGSNLLDEEVGFFQAVRAALVKTSVTSKLSDRAKNLAIEQLLNGKGER